MFGAAGGCVKVEDAIVIIGKPVYDIIASSVVVILGINLCVVGIDVAENEGGLGKVEGEQVQVGGVPLGAGGGRRDIEVSDVEIGLLGVILDRYGEFFKVLVGTDDVWLSDFFERD